MNNKVCVKYEIKYTFSFGNDTYIADYCERGLRGRTDCYKNGLKYNNVSYKTENLGCKSYSPIYRDTTIHLYTVLGFVILGLFCFCIYFKQKKEM